MYSKRSNAFTDCTNQNFNYNKKQFLLRGILLLLAFILGFSINKIKAQDLHFTQFYNAPIAINPAHTGLFNGKGRLATTFRNQWWFLPFPYRTNTFTFDYKLGTKHLEDNAIAFGLYVQSDRAGKGNIATQGIGLSFAAHKSVSESGSTIGAGIQYGYFQTGFNPAVLKFGDQIFSGATLTSETFASTQVAYQDVHAGLLVNIKTLKRSNYIIGISLHHILKPSLTFFKDPAANTINRKYNFQFGMAYALGAKTVMLPSFLAVHQFASTQILMGSGINYKFTEKLILKSGLWWRQTRNADAIVLLMGLEYNRITFGFTFDGNISSLKNVSNGRGAIETALLYKFGKVKQYKKYKVNKRLITCPVFE